MSPIHFLRATKLLLLTVGICALTAPFLANLVAGDAGPAISSSEGSYVILLRHGDAPGRNEPHNFDLNDCSTQRNLSEKGRNEAREIGDALRARHIVVEKVLASRFCRARETAELLSLGPVENNAVFDNLEFNKSRAVYLMERERQLIASWHGPGALLIVTHGSNIKALTGLEVEQGTMILARPTGESHTVIHFETMSLTKSPS
jgi:phosphohistidine phosphatase SixA